MPKKSTTLSPDSLCCDMYGFLYAIHCILSFDDQ